MSYEYGDEYIGIECLFVEQISSVDAARLFHSYVSYKEMQDISLLDVQDMLTSVYCLLLPESEFF